MAARAWATATGTPPLSVCFRAWPPIGTSWWSPWPACSPGTWLADLCARAGLACVLGHAWSMNAIPGGQAKYDTSEAHTMAGLHRGGRLPPASVSPAARRAPRDLLRRRRPRIRTRAARLANLQKTTSQYTLPEMGQTLAYQANRHGVAARCLAPAVQKRLAVDRALLDHSDRWRRDLGRSIRTTATPQAANPRSRLRPVPGLGEMLSRVLRDAIHDLQRVPRGQARWHIRDHDGPGLAHMGLLGSRGALVPRPSCGSAGAGPLREQTEPGERLDRPRPPMSPCGL
jgi:hypothetical protein